MARGIPRVRSRPGDRVRSTVSSISCLPRQLPISRWCGVALSLTVVLAVLFTSGCDSASTTRQKTSAAARSVESLPTRDDPAMKEAQARTQEQDDELQDDADDEALELAPDKLSIDEAAGLVYVPDIGWMDVASFSTLYLNEPDRLPGEFDHQAVHALLQQHKN